MAEYIAHASIDENGKISGGKAGDQTKKEVCMRSCYSNTWHYVLRIQNEPVRIQFANNMIDLANNECVGYDQNQRNTLLTAAKKADFDFSKINVMCECDCSSAIAICLLGAIYKICGEQTYNSAYKILFISGNSVTTRTLRKQMQKIHELDLNVISINKKISKLKNSVYGDIYLKEGSHVVAFVASGVKTSVPESSVNISYYPIYTGTSCSIVDALNSLGVDSSKANRGKIAVANGIEHYTATATQNTELLKLAKKGKLLKPHS